VRYATVVAMNLKEDEDQTKENVVEADINELSAEYRDRPMQYTIHPLTP